MNQPQRRPLNVAQMMQRFPGVPPLEVQMIQECEKTIKEALTKFGCMLVFEQITHNGMPVGGGFQVHRRPGGEIARPMMHPAQTDLNAPPPAEPPSDSNGGEAA